MTCFRGTRSLMVLVLLIAGAFTWHEQPVRADVLAMRPAAQILLSVSGNGITNTRSFRAPGDWRIVYKGSGTVGARCGDPAR